jgi:hypothetical protein
MNRASADRLGRLDDYVTGAFDDAEAASFEQAMFEAVGTDAESEADVQFFDRSAVLIGRFVARGGRLVGPSTEQDIHTLRAHGLKVHVIDVEVPKGGRIEFSPWPEDVQFVVFRNHVDVRDFEDIEVEIENPDGTRVKTFRGVESDPATGHIYALCVEPLARMAFATKPRVTRFTGVRAGKREVITEYSSVPILQR